MTLYTFTVITILACIWFVIIVTPLAIIGLLINLWLYERRLE